MDPIWIPAAEAVARARLTEFRRDLSEATGVDLETADDLHRFSIESCGDFWDAVWGECGIVGDRGDGPAYVLPPAGADLRSARFFPAARLNFAGNLLAGSQRPGTNPEAIVFRREDGVRRVLTWTELHRQTTALARQLRALGVEPGDRVAAWMPNVPETVVAMLAAASIGAIFTSTSPDFGVAGVLDRFGQVAPTVLLAADGYVYANKRHDRLKLLTEVVAGLPSLRAIVVHGELNPDPDLEEVRAAAGTRWVVNWRELTRARDGAAAGSEPDGPAVFDEFPFDHPLYVLYSSGTTGAPKCIVHRAGGILLKHVSEHQLHCDIRPGDRVFFFTTCGWMMWNWLVSALAGGATIVLYDGSPLHPGPDAMWELVEHEQVTLFGTSAKYLDAVEKAGVRPAKTRDLSALRTICSTGSPLGPEGFEYVYRDVKEDVHLASISGGTDICGCFVIGDPTRPVFAGQIQGPALGMAVDVWDEDGRSLRDRPGVRGELVCMSPFPSMPLGFWGDADGSKYENAYFRDFPGVWAHGDFASWTGEGGFVIHGRSDATLNAGGVRIGTAEIYRQVEQVSGVAEALAVGQEWDNDTRIVLFVRIESPGSLDDDLRRTISRRLREHCSPRHVPALIVEVVDLPRTRSGKLAELVVADLINKRPVRNVAGLANPECLDQFADLAELRA